MKKKVLISSALLLSGLVFSQVGINTTEPKATFDISAKSESVDPNSIEGILIPRVDRLKAQSMLNIETSTLVFINDVSTGTLDGITVNVDKPWYYFFDGTNWKKLITKDDIQNIYNTNGQLTSDRTVAQDVNKLAFTASQTNAFSVDGTTLSVDAANDRVGMGTAAPTAKLDVVGSATVPTMRVQNLTLSATTTIANKLKMVPILVDETGVMVRQFSAVDGPNSYSLENGFGVTSGGAAVNIFTGIGTATIVTFKFNTSLSFGNSNTGQIYGQISYSTKRGFQLASDWSYSGNSASSAFTVDGIGTNTLTFASNNGTLIFGISGANITAAKTGGGTANINVFEGKKIR